MKLSVCMATYNGADYIGEQIRSILPQLSDSDELVIVDDASEDGTISAIESFGDKRIRIIRQESNGGVVQAFVRAMLEASGDVLFLSDQDDIWREDKVRKFIERFNADPQLSVVVSDCYVVDSAGEIRASTRFKSGKFVPGILRNLITNHYQGSNMALRRQALDYCLPIPPGIPIHDMWIGMANQLVGRTGYIDEPLMYYRRHDKNFTQEKRAPLLVVLGWRWVLAKNLARLYIQKKVLSRSSFIGTRP